MNKLKGQLVYLAGFIDDNPELAKGWRDDMTEFLQGLGIGVFDPMDKPILNTFVHEDKNFVADVNTLKKEGKYDEVTSIMKEIVRQDLKMVDLSNFVILNIDRTCHMCGSYTEFTYSCMQRKPVLVYCKQGIKAISNWMWGLGDYNHFFEDWDALKQHIIDVDSGRNLDDLNGKWRFIDYDKVFGRKI
jgi:hypothetical protein